MGSLPDCSVKEGTFSNLKRGTFSDLVKTGAFYSELGQRLGVLFIIVGQKHTISIVFLFSHVIKYIPSCPPPGTEIPNYLTLSTP